MASARRFQRGLGLAQCSLTQSSSAKPRMAAGMDPTTTMPHKRHVPFFSTLVLRGEKGFSLWKYRMSTAIMAPSWMTTRNSARNSSDTCSFTNSSTRIMWPVDEMGSHSVMPSTMPMRRAFSASKIINVVPRLLESVRKRG